MEGTLPKRRKLRERMIDMSSAYAHVPTLFKTTSSVSTTTTPESTVMKSGGTEAVKTNKFMLR
jgi:hypothetical protein